jgi:hypothetical protein
LQCACRGIRDCKFIPRRETCFSKSETAIYKTINCQSFGFCCAAEVARLQCGNIVAKARLSPATLRWNMPLCSTKVRVETLGYLWPFVVRGLANGHMLWLV